MKTETVLKSKVIDHFTLIIDSEDGTPVQTWKLAYDYRAIAKIEEAIGKDIKKIESWKDLSSGKDFPTIVWGGLARFNPEVTLEQVLDMLNPEAQRILTDEIFKLMFPGAAEAYEKILKAKESGEPQAPNAPAEPTKS